MYCMRLINLMHQTESLKLHSTVYCSNIGENMQISEFQDLMRNLYFRRDSQRGIQGTYNWLVDEVNELGEEIKKGTNRDATEKEFADVIAWLASLANIMGVDLQAAAINKYNYKCPKCQHAPCQCNF